MYLIHLIYASTAVHDFQPGDIEKLLDQARENNKSADLTGMLCFNKNYFLQVLEGSRTKVNDLYQSIARDPRHGNLQILGYNEIVRREFDEWSMGYIPTSGLSDKLNLRFSGSRLFSPYEMSGENCYQMMIELKSILR